MIRTQIEPNCEPNRTEPNQTVSGLGLELYRTVSNRVSSRVSSRVLEPNWTEPGIETELWTETKTEIETETEFVDRNWTEPYCIVLWKFVIS